MSALLAEPVTPAPVDSVAGRAGRRMLSWAPPFLALVGLFILWEVWVRVRDVPTYLVPPPSAIFAEMWHSRELLRDELWYTLRAAVGGLVLGAGFAACAATLMLWSRALTRTLLPLLVVTQVVPMTALAPLFLVWFGFGLTPKIVIAAVISFFPIVVSMLNGFRSTDFELLQLLETVGASRRDLLRRVQLPTALPHVVGGLKVAVTLAVIGAVVGEFVGADHGLAALVKRAQVRIQTELLFAGLFTLAAVGIVLFGIVSGAERLLLRSRHQEAPRSMLRGLGRDAELPEGNL